MGGDPYQACVTIQFGYKPSANTTMLTVEPQMTEVAVTTKTQEQMQQEAQQNGGFSVWHEFTWSYPWYRLHIDAQVNPSLFYCLDLFGSGGLDFVGMQNRTIDMGMASSGALVEGGIIVAVSTGIILSPEKLVSVMIGGASLFIGTMIAIGAAYVYNSEDYTSFVWGMLTILSIALYVTTNYLLYASSIYVWARSMCDLWATFSQSPAVAVLITAMTGYFSFALLQIWPPLLRGMLSIPMVICIMTMWALLYLG